MPSSTGTIGNKMANTNEIFSHMVERDNTVDIRHLYIPRIPESVSQIIFKKFSQWPFLLKVLHISFFR